MKAALQINPVSAGLVEMADTLLAVFGPSQPSAASIDAFMQHQAPVLKLMLEFADKHPVTFVCELLSETNRRMKYWEWILAAEWICTADIRLEQYPALDACVKLYSGANKLRGHSLFVSNLVGKLVDVRMHEFLCTYVRRQPDQDRTRARVRQLRRAPRRGFGAGVARQSGLLQQAPPGNAGESVFLRFFRIFISVTKF